MKQYDTVVLGASAFACGMALCAPGRVCILERGILLAPEYTAALHRPVLSAAQTDAGRRLRRELSERGIAVGDRVHLPPVADVLALLLTECRAQMLLQCETVDMVAEADGYLLKVMATDGIGQLRARRIVDTTPEGFRSAGVDAIARRAICAALLGHAAAPLPEQPIPTEVGQVTVYTGALPDEYLIRLELPRDAGFGEARRRLHRAFRSAAPRLPGLLFGAEAVAMVNEYDGAVCRSMSPAEGAPFDWIPSGQYGDLIEALEEGCTWISQH